jgi:hypothetical protein
MKRMKQKLHHIANNPATQKALTSLKPEKTLWGFLGVILFFIAPEIIAFIWGAEITAYAKETLLHAPSLVEKSYGDLLVMLFEDGGSWVNLLIGTALLIWLLF